MQLEIAGANLAAGTRIDILTFSQLRLGALFLPWTGTGADALDFNDLQDACSVCGFNSDLFFALVGLLRCHSTFPFRPTAIYICIAAQKRSR